MTSIELPDETEFLGSEFIQETSVRVESQAPVSVYIHQFNAFRSEATIVLPVSSISNQYFVMSYTGVNSGFIGCLLYTSPSPRDKRQSRMPSSA